jgi:hypothetical protein
MNWTAEEETGVRVRLTGGRGGGGVSGRKGGKTGMAVDTFLRRLGGVGEKEEGGGGRRGRATRQREKEGEKGGAGSAVGPHGRDGSGRRCQRRQRALEVEAGWRTGEDCRRAGNGARV